MKKYRKKEVRKVLKKIYQELVQIREQLQAIQSYIKCISKENKDIPNYIPLSSGIKPPDKQPAKKANSIMNGTIEFGKTLIEHQFEELDAAIEDCIRKLRDETTGTGVRVLIAEFEELMLLRTKILTQKVINDQRADLICKKYKYKPVDGMQ